MYYHVTDELDQSLMQAHPLAIRRVANALLAAAVDFPEDTETVEIAEALAGWLNQVAEG